MLRIAEPHDWPTIARWRSEHFARMQARNGLPSCAGRTLADAVWIVATDEQNEPAAAISFVDYRRARTVYDFYFRAGFGGRRAAVRLLRVFLDITDRDCQVEVAFGNTNASNVAYRNLLQRFDFVEYSLEPELDVVHFVRSRGGLT